MASCLGFRVVEKDDNNENKQINCYDGAATVDG